MSYEECRDNIMTKIMHEFRDKELTNRAGQTITDRKQALAIGLNETQRFCEYNKDERKHFMEKVIKDLSNIKKKIIVTNLNETLNIIKVLIKNNKKMKAHKIYKMLIDKITYQHSHNISKMNKNMWIIFKHISSYF